MATLVKYPRTPHLPWSPGATRDDCLLKDTRGWQGREVVITTKMDGENTTLYKDAMHARSLDSQSGRADRSRVAAIRGAIRWDLLDPEMRICGENMTAVHSIHYTDLADWFLVFSIWDRDHCVPWTETTTWCNFLRHQALATVPVLYEGPYSDEICKRLCAQVEFLGQEGLVVRPAASFRMPEFPTLVAKYVRAGHVQTPEHWTRRITYNSLANNPHA